MSLRQTLVILLILTTLVVPFVQLSIGFYYIKSIQLCPLQPDLALLLSIGGVFKAIFFASAFGFVYSITPAKFKTKKESKPDEEVNEKRNSRASQCLIGSIMCIIGVCATLFFILLHMRVFGNYNKVQYNNPSAANYCLSTIFYGAFGLIIATYVALILFFICAIVLIVGIGA